MSNHPHPIHKFDRPSERVRFVRIRTVRVRPEEVGRKLDRRAKRLAKKERRK